MRLFLINRLIMKWANAIGIMAYAKVLWIDLKDLYFQNSGECVCLELLPEV